MRIIPYVSIAEKVSFLFTGESNRCIPLKVLTRNPINKIASSIPGQDDLEVVSRIISHHTNHVAVSITRDLERLEERITAAESRILARLEELQISN